MNHIQEIFRDHGDAYLARYGDQMPTNHRKVISAIQKCGTSECGVHLFVCEDCRDAHRTGSSCGNRHCPVCQAGKSDEWLRKQMDKMLPVTTFMITFTVPEPLRRIFRKNPEICYAALFQAASGAMKKLAKDPRHIGCDTAGFTGILHTWTRQLEYHPHVHFIVPGGGIDKDGTEWKSSDSHFYLPAKPLSIIYRAKLVAILNEAGIDVPRCVWDVDWVVNVKNVGDGKSALKYLTQYVFRVAIGSSRILSVAHGKVRFKYKRTGEKKWRSCELEVFEFIRRYLQHVLPHGFTKVRHYGFMSPNSRVLLQKIRELICLLYEILVPLLPKKETRKKKPWVCEHCGSPIVWYKFTPPNLQPG